MKAYGPRRFLALGLAAALAMTASAVAHDGHDHKAAPHGGTLAEAAGQHFEVVFTRDGVALYPLTAGHEPIDASTLTGKVTFYHPNAPKRPWFERPLAPVAAAPGERAASLGLKVSLAKAPAEGVTATFDIQGLSHPARFGVPVVFADGQLAIAKATAADRAAVEAQKTCPVSGEDLAAMGGPLKLSRAGRSVLVCCEGCVDTVKADPAKFLAGPAKPPTGHEHHH